MIFHNPNREERDDDTYYEVHTPEEALIIEISELEKKIADLLAERDRLQKNYETIASAQSIQYEDERLKIS